MNFLPDVSDHKHFKQFMRSSIDKEKRYPADPFIIHQKISAIHWHSNLIFFQDIFPDHYLSQEINQLQIRCPKCNQSIDLAQVENHLVSSCENHAKLANKVEVEDDDFKGKVTCSDCDMLLSEKIAHSISKVFK